MSDYDYDMKNRRLRRSWTKGIRRRSSRFPTQRVGDKLKARLPIATRCRWVRTGWRMLWVRTWNTRSGLVLGCPLIRHLAGRRVRQRRHPGRRSGVTENRTVHSIPMTLPTTAAYRPRRGLQRSVVRQINQQLGRSRANPSWLNPGTRRNARCASWTKSPQSGDWTIRFSTCSWRRDENSPPTQRRWTIWKASIPRHSASDAPHDHSVSRRLSATQ